MIVTPSTGLSSISLNLSLLKSNRIFKRHIKFESLNSVWCGNLLNDFIRICRLLHQIDAKMSHWRRRRLTTFCSSHIFFSLYFVYVIYFLDCVILPYWFCGHSQLLIVIPNEKQNTHTKAPSANQKIKRENVNHSIWFVHRKCASLISKTRNIFSIISYKTKCHTKSKRVRAFKRAEQKIELIKNALNEKLSMRSGKKGSEISWQVGNKWAATTKKCVNGNQKWLWEDETNEERKETVCKMCGKAIDDFFPSHYGNIVSHCTLMPAEEKFVVVVFSLGRYLCL